MMSMDDGWSIEKVTVDMWLSTPMKKPGWLIDTFHQYGNIIIIIINLLNATFT
jgi:hypothetical protein